MKLRPGDLRALRAAGVTSYRETADGVEVLFGPIDTKTPSFVSDEQHSVPVPLIPDALRVDRLPPAPPADDDPLALIVEGRLPDLAPEYGGPTS